MKTAFAAFAIAALAFAGTASRAEAQSHCGSGPSSYTYVSGYRSCGTPIYTQKYFAGYDHCGRVIWKYRVISPPVQYRPVSRNYHHAPPQYNYGHSRSYVQSYPSHYRGGSCR